MAEAIALGWKAFTDLVRPTTPQAMIDQGREADHTIEMVRRITEGMKRNG